MQSLEDQRLILCRLGTLSPFAVGTRDIANCHPIQSPSHLTLGTAMRSEMPLESYRVFQNEDLLQARAKIRQARQETDLPEQKPEVL